MDALAEAIWSALDVDADHVGVAFEFTRLEAIKTIVVTDDGEGMNSQRASIGFGEYGDSWKRRIDVRAHNGRSVHGQRGQGRYDILHFGTSARWTSIAEQVDGKLGVIEIELEGRRAAASSAATPVSVTGTRSPRCEKPLQPRLPSGICSPP